MILTIPVLGLKKVQIFAVMADMSRLIRSARAAICDAYDVMIHERAYKKEYNSEKALNEIKRKDILVASLTPNCQKFFGHI